MSRRGLLMLGGVGLTLAGLGLKEARAAEPRATRAPLPRKRVELGGVPKLIVARGPSPAKNVEALLGRIGGMGKLVSKGDMVCIKPNVGWDRTPAQAANTDPDVVFALVTACLAAGAQDVLVLDNSVNDNARSFERSGIRAAVEKAGGRVLLAQQAEKREIELPGKGRYNLLEPLLTATKVINVPVAKHHGLTQFTGGLKNWFGAVAGSRRELHPRIEESIVGLASLLRPTVTFVDATRVLLRNGPSGGNLADVKRLDTVALSFDPVAVDAWAAYQLGFDPAQIQYLVLGARRGLGKLDWRSLRPVEINAPGGG
jgi:uncharacterized protein (DUF362 family)